LDWERKSSSADPKVIVIDDIGSIGGFYAFILGRNPSVNLSVVARSNYEEVKTKVNEFE